MMVIRPVEWDDRARLLELASQTGIGFTSLSGDEQQLLARLDRVLKTWRGDALKAEQGYLFVLEETEQHQVVGMCGIEVAIGLNEPWYNYRLGTLVHASKSLNVYTQMKTLYLSNDHTGYSELCTLFLDPAFRHSKNGQLLSKSRMMFIAGFPQYFSDKIIAEMRGVSDDSGHAPFWESLGRHFFSMDFSAADHLTGIGQKSFIAELMPKHPLYVDFLTEAAQAVIGEVHPCTVPARKILEGEGMHYEGYIDIFDGGPTLESHVRDLRIVKDSRVYSVAILEQPSLDEGPVYLLSNEQYRTFRATISPVRILDQELILTPEQASVLRVHSGDPIRAVPLFSTQPRRA